MNRTKLRHTLLNIAFALLSFLAGLVHADDTDVYLTGTDVIADEKPSILIILDNSGSMTATVPNSSEPYDKDTTYSGSFNASRIYWTDSACSSLGSTTTQWFPAANYRCNSTQAELTNKGSYQDRYAYWSSVAGVKSWASLKAGVNNPAHVDCQSDYNGSDPNTGNLGYPTNTGKDTSNNNITGPYTTTKSLANIIGSGTRPTGGARWSGFSQPRLCTGNYVNYLKSPAAQSKTRIQLAAQVTRDIIDTTANVRFGMMIYNRNTPTDSYNGARVVSGIKDMTAANKTALKAIVNTIETQVSSGNGTYTPLSETLWEAYRYFAGLTVDYGNDDTTQTPARDTCAEGYNADPTQCSYTGTYTSPFEFACQKAYIILITDGEPTKDNHANTASRINSLPGLGTCDNTGNISDGYCLDDLAGWMNNVNNDVLATRDGKQNVSTYTIRIKDPTEFDSGLLDQTASKGGGKSYLAETSQDIATSFQAAVAEILDITTSFAAPSLSVNAFNKLFNRNSVYFSLFKPETTARWNGNIKNFSIKNCLKTEADLGDCTSNDCVNSTDATKCVYGKIVDANKKLVVDNDSRIKETACSFWSDCTISADGAEVTMGGSGSKVPKRADRTIFTYTGATAPSNVVLNDNAHKLVDANTALTFDMLGLTHASTGDADADAATDAAARTARINWIRGQDSDPAATEDRWTFGDALHSRPLTVSYGGTDASPVIKIFVGSNDGGLRMINEATGVEEWAFFPPELLAPLQGKLEANDKGGTPPHPYALDGTPTAWVYDKDDDGVIEPDDGDFVRIFISMRRGGSNIYAFDVTPTGVCTTSSCTINPKYMWKIEGGVPNTDFYKLAQTWSAPSVTYIRHGTSGIASERKAVLIFGGGYYPTQDKTWGADEITTGVNAGKGVGTGNAIFIVDPTNGSRLWWASAPGSGATKELANMNFSIPSDVAFLDANGDGETDRLYVGDMGGQLWRLDLGATLKKDDNGGSTGARLLVVADGDYTTTADNRKFFYPPDVAQVTDTTFSTVADYDMVTIGTGDREDPLNKVPHNQLYAVRDTLINSKIPNNFTPLTVSNLYDATLNKIQDGDPDEQAAALVALKAAKGWYIDLVEVASWKGEKALAPSITLNGVAYFTTYLPADPDTNNTCKPQEGTGLLYALNLLNAEAVFDATGDGLSKGDRTADLGGGIPSELVPVFQETGVTGLVGVGGGAKAIDPNIRLPRIKTFWHQ